MLVFAYPKELGLHQSMFCHSSVSHVFMWMALPTGALDHFKISMAPGEKWSVSQTKSTTFLSFSAPDTEVFQEKSNVQPGRQTYRQSYKSVIIQIEFIS